MSDATAFRPQPADGHTGGAAIMPLQIEDLVLRFGETTILNGLNLELGQTGCTMIIGPNGAGKSLLLKLMHGLMEPTSGRMDWGGRKPAEVTARQALVFQNPVLLRRSVAGNMDFVLRARKKSKELGTTLLRQVDLLHKADQPARRLSGGEAQRLAVARALAIEPDVLLLDEPTANLDPASVQTIERIIDEVRTRGVRIIFVTHDIGQARRMADDVVFLHRGVVTEHSPASVFFSKPRSEAARVYLSGGIVV